MSKCESKVTFKPFKKFERLKWTFSCSVDTTWIGVHSCCGATSKCCEAHHELATSSIGGIVVKCGECGADSTITWRKL